MIQTLSHQELWERFGKLVRTERKITRWVLEYLNEIEARRLHVDRAFPSLYEMLVKEFGYSPAAAMRRIESARLLREIPEVAEKLESGKLNLSQLAQVQQSLKIRAKFHPSPVSSEVKSHILKKIESHTFQQTQVLLSQVLEIPPPQLNSIQVHADESVTMTLTLTREQMAALNEAKALVSHAVPSQNWSEVITYLANKEVRRRTSSRDSLRTPSKAECSQELSPEISKSKEASLSSKSVSSSSSLQRNPVPLPPRLRKKILEVSTGCQYRDPASGRRCSNRSFSQIDHRHPRWAGGDHDPDNLQILCASHNLRKYQREAGIRKWRPS